MREWMDQARVGAAREFGARHYRGFAAAEFGVSAVRRLLVPVVLLGAVGAAAWWVWHKVGGGALPWATIGIVVAVIAVVILLVATRLIVPVIVLGGLAGAGWVLWHLVTGWAGPVRSIGLVLCAVALVVTAVSRSLWTSRLSAVVVPVGAAAVAVVVDLGWLRPPLWVVTTGLVVCAVGLVVGWSRGFGRPRSRWLD